MAGVKIIGSHGVTQIDDTYKNLQLRQTGYVTTGELSTAPYGYANVNYLASYPVFALRPLVDGRAFGVTAQYVEGNGSFTTQIISGGGNLTLQYYVFDMVPDTTPYTVGLRIRNSAGAVTFDSNYKYLRMLDAMTGYSGRNIGYRPGTVEAAVFCTPSVSQEGGSGYYQMYYNAAQLNAGGWITDGTVYTDYHDTSDYGNNNDYNPSYNAKRLINIIDVAGY